MAREEEDFVFIGHDDALDASRSFEREAETILAPQEWPSLPAAEWDMTHEYEQRDAPLKREQNGGSFAAALSSGPLSRSPPDAAALPRPIRPPVHCTKATPVMEEERRARARNRPRREREIAGRWDEAQFFHDA